MSILITGAAGFIGFHLANKLLDADEDIIGIDNINDYYDISLKENRLKVLKDHKNYNKFQFIKGDIYDKETLENIFSSHKIDYVINLAAQAGVRYSLSHPHKYIDSNIVGFTNLIELSRLHKVKHFIYASSSSVYGMTNNHPFSLDDRADQPISLYAASKRSNELIAYSYSHLYKLPTTGLRFFTVYGPYGRPDMAYYKFTKAILEEEPIDIYNNGQMSRDFTYIDDIIYGIVKILEKTPIEKRTIYSNSSAPYELFNIGNNKPVTLMKFIESIERACKKKSIKNFLPMQKGDVTITFADIDDITNKTGFTPKTNIDDGILHFVKWFIKYYEYKK